MRNTLVRNGAAAWCLLLVVNAHAAIVDHGGYFTDTATQLDWLDLTETQSQSIDDLVNNRLGPGQDLAGWGYATGAQFETLMLSFGAVPDLGCIDGTQFCQSFSQPNGVVAPVLDLMGDLFNVPGIRGISYGILADAVSPDIRWAVLLQDFDDNSNDDVRTHFAQITLAAPSSNFGSLLVRSAMVPLPAAVWLLGPALVGLLSRRRQR